MDRISEDFCLVYFWGNPADLMPEKERSKDHSLPAGRYAWRFTQPYIYISYTSPLSIITIHIYTSMVAESCFLDVYICP